MQGLPGILKKSFDSISHFGIFLEKKSISDPAILKKIKGKKENASLFFKSSKDKNCLYHWSGL
jgi:hypothetical protein